MSRAPTKPGSEERAENTVKHHARSATSRGVKAARKLKSPYKPRHAAFAAFHKRTKRFAVALCHRRSGKTVWAVNELVHKALTTAPANALHPCQFAYICPERSQAKRNAWSYLKQYALFAAAFNGRKPKFHESELWVELVNGARIYVLGASNPETIRGLYFDGVILDEAQGMTEHFFNLVLSATLLDRQGWVVYSGTPNGPGSLLHKRYVEALAHPEQYDLLVLKASESGIYSDAALAAERQNIGEDAYNQEYELSWDAPARGSYFAEMLRRAEKEGRIKPQLINDQYAVESAWDLGFTDGFAVWFFQRIDNKTHYVGYFETIEETFEPVLDKFEAYIRNLGGTKGTMWLPHDARHRNLMTGGSPAEVLDKLKYDFVIVPKTNDVERDIQICKQAFERVEIDSRLEDGLNALKNYSRAWSNAAKVFLKKPDHNIWSHGADAFRYSIMGWDLSKLYRPKRRNPKDIGDYLLQAPTIDQLLMAGARKKRRGHGKWF